MSTTDELKSCPFCGGEAIIMQVGIDSNPKSSLDGKYIIGCDGINGSLCPGYIYKCSPLYVNKELAVKMWNNRKKIPTRHGTYHHIYPIYDANHKIIRYEIYSENCTKPINKLKYVGNITVEEENK